MGALTAQGSNGKQGKFIRSLSSALGLGKDPFLGFRLPGRGGARPAAGRATGPRASVLGGALGRTRPLNFKEGE